MTSFPYNLKIIPGKRWLEILLLFVNDLFGFGIAFGFVGLVRFYLFPTQSETLFDPQVVRTMIYLATFSLAMLAIRGLYPGWCRTSVVELKQVTETIILAYIGVGVLIFIQRTVFSFSRSVFILSSVFAVVIISIGRFLVRKFISHYPWWGEPIVVIGLEDGINNVASRLLTCRRLGLRPVVGLTVDKTSDKSKNIPIKPWSLKLQKTLTDARIKTVILAITTSELREKYPQVYKHVSLGFQSTIFIIDNDIYGSMMAQPIDINGQPAVISKQSLLNPFLRFVKMAVEILLGLVLILPILILGLILSIWIKLDSPGPVFYTQERIGVNKKSFRLYKFRTMVVNSDEVLDNMLKDPQIKEKWEKYHKLSDDRRITRAGKWIRKFSLDELPQFINILRGEMSLIGPRPLVKSEIDEIGEPAELILRVRPGLTGWWQVMGRNNLSFHERTQLDFYYVFNWSLWLDLFIFFKTFWVMIFERNGT